MLVMKSTQRVLVTGSAGRLGRAAVRALVERGHRVFGFDRVPTPRLPAEQYHVGTFDDVETLNRLVAAVDCVIHLAATPDDAQFPRGPAPDDGDNFLSELVPNNVIGPYRVMEAIRKAGVRRVVLASTGQVIDGHLRDGNVPVTASLPPRPRYLYAATKVFLEALGQVYAGNHGIEVLAVRLGWCPRDRGQIEEIAQSAIGQDVFLSPGDAGRFFVGCVEADKLPAYAVAFATSLPTHSLRYDLGPARRLVDYQPQDRWPTGADAFD